MSTLTTTPPPPYSDSTIPRVIGSGAALLGIALITYGARIYSRSRPHWNIWLDDYAITIAMIFSLANFGVTVGSELHSGGRHTLYIPQGEFEKAMHLNYVSMPLWVWSVTWIKISVSLMLLRIKRSPAWKWGLGSLMAILLVVAVAATVCQLLQCNPIRANWDFSIPRDKCWPPRTFHNVIYATSAIIITTDFACALLPLTFIRKINRPLREKVVISILMGLGLLASASGIGKLISVHNLMQWQDPIWDGAGLSIWTCAEEYLGIIAACIPCLKSLLETAFRRLGGQITSLSNSKNGPRTGLTSSIHEYTLNDFSTNSQNKTFANGELDALSQRESDEDVLVDDILRTDSKTRYTISESEARWPMR